MGYTEDLCPAHPSSTPCALEETANLAVWPLGRSHFGSPQHPGSTQRVGVGTHLGQASAWWPRGQSLSWDAGGEGEGAGGRNAVVPLPTLVAAGERRVRGRQTDARWKDRPPPVVCVPEASSVPEPSRDVSPWRSLPGVSLRSFVALSAGLRLVRGHSELCFKMLHSLWFGDIYTETGNRWLEPRRGQAGRHRRPGEN